MNHPARRIPSDRRLKVIARARYVGHVLSAFTAQGSRRRTVMRLRVILPHWDGRQHIVNIDVSTFGKYCQALREFGDYSDLSVKDASRFGKWIRGKQVRVLLTHYEWHTKSEVQQMWAGDLLEVLQDESV